MCPGIDNLVIPFTLGQNTRLIVFMDFTDLLFRIIDNLLFLFRYFQVGNPKAQSCKCYMFEAQIFYSIQQIYSFCTSSQFETVTNHPA
ncbi:hypothetical protein ES703_113027 [subsurface metagenome]